MQILTNVFFATAWLFAIASLFDGPTSFGASIFCLAFTALALITNRWGRKRGN